MIVSLERIPSHGRSNLSTHVGRASHREVDWYLAPQVRPLPRTVRRTYGGGAVSYERGTPVDGHQVTTPRVVQGGNQPTRVLGGTKALAISTQQFSSTVRSFGRILRGKPVQGYLAHTKTHPPRTLPYPMPRVLGGSKGGGRFLVSEVNLYVSVTD